MARPLDPSPAQSLPRPEHPRPDLRREPWINLNGRWRFTFDPDDVGEQVRWYRAPHPALDTAAATTERGASFGTSSLLGASVVDPFTREIVVPFPWESRLSGIGDATYKGAAWYQRLLEVPADWAAADADAGPRVAQGLPSAEDTAAATSAVGARVRWRRRPYLCFGAVDWNAKVWVDGRFVGEHDGGYTPFALDLSRYLRPGRPATLTVRAWDSSAADTPIGKQTALWYTHSGGIWQTVWLEGRGAAHLAAVQITPRLEDGTAEFAMRVQAAPEAVGSYRLAVAAPDGAFPTVEGTVEVGAAPAEVTLTVRVPAPRAWSPEDPHLYECAVSLAPTGAAGSGDAGAPDDVVHTYFGLRSITRGAWEGRPYEFVLLNGEPIYLRGALDQAFHPDGLHAYPSDDAIRADVQAAKDLGLNMLRCHIKVNEPRYYYWADRLGVLVMYDLPSAGVYTPKARANWEQTFREALERDRSHPSIFAWILFNETWGLEEHQTPASWSWVREMYELAKGLDPSRLVEDNSATLYDHVVSDINTWHFYIDDYARAKRHVERVVAQTYEGSAFNYVGGLYGHEDAARDYRQGAYPLLNSEYAGLSASGGDRDIAYSFKYLTTELRRHDKICGYVYTELADVEWEHNGFLNYDRSRKEFGYEAFVPGMTVADLNAADIVGLDCPPCQTLAPGGVFAAAAFVSHWGKAPIEGATLRWQATAIDRFGEPLALGEGERAVQLRRYGVTEAGMVEVRLPDEPGLVTVALWLVDGSGAVRARNYVNVDVYDRPPAPVTRRGGGWALSIAPEDFLDSSWPNPTLGRGQAKFGAAGAGWVEYAVALPEEVDPGAARGLRLRFEAAARTARNRVGWRAAGLRRPTDYPQTEATKLPTDLAVSVNGVPLGTVRLPDDPADARGVLSLHLQGTWEFASYGFLTTLAAEGDAVGRILAAAADRRLVVRFEVPRGGVQGGLNLYGARMGASPVAPTVFLDF